VKATTHLRFEGLRRRFGRLAVLKGVSGEVASGDALLVTGPNGSGKSTLLRCLAGLMAPEAGAIEHVEDGLALGTPERRRRVGLVAPDLAFYEELSAIENLRFFARLRGLKAARAEELLARVDLPGDRLAGALSSGMRQRLRWAWALLARPRVLLLDEPFQNFDAPGEAVARELLAEHLAGGGLAVVASPGRLEIPRVASRVELS
jgi:heme exporter protein A